MSTSTESAISGVTVAVPNLDLTHLWPLDEGSGLVAFDVVGNDNGALSPTATRVWPGWIGNGAVHLDGSDGSFVDFGTAVGQFGTNDFAVGLWFRTSEQLRYFDIVGNRTAGSHGNFFNLRMTGHHESAPEGRVTAEVDQDGTGYIAVDSSRVGLNDGLWHHAAAVRRGNRLTLYIDGQPSGDGTADVIANIQNGNPFKLGRSLQGVTDRFAPVADYADLRVYGLGKAR
jgi:hypothetical protein